MDTVNDLHHREHQEWLSLIHFYEDELKIFRSELLRVADKHPNLPSIEGQVLEYKSFFNRKEDRLDKLKFGISQHELSLSHSAHFSHKSSESHHEIRDVIESFKSDFEQLKISFRRFASHND